MKLIAACGDLTRPFYVPYIEPSGELVEKLKRDWKDSRKVFHVVEGRLIDGAIEVFDGFLIIDAMKVIAPEAEIDIVVRDCDVYAAIGTALTLYADKYSAHPLYLSDALVEVKSRLGRLAADSKISKWCNGRYSESAIGHLVKLSSLYEGFRQALKKGQINFTLAKALSYKKLSEQVALYTKYSERSFAGIEVALGRKPRAVSEKKLPQPLLDDISNEPSIKLLSDLLCTPINATMDAHGKMTLKFGFTNLDIGSGVMDAISRAGFSGLEGAVEISVNDAKLEGLLTKLSGDEY